MPKVTIDAVQPKRGSDYPAPYDTPLAGREARNVAAHDLAESAAALEQLARGERTGDVATAYRNLVFQISRITCR